MRKPFHSPTGPRAAFRYVSSRLAQQAGIALPVTVTMLFVISSLAFVVAGSVTSAESQSTRDRSTKRAIAAADAGYDTAVYRLNKMTPLPNGCVSVGYDGSL